MTKVGFILFPIKYWVSVYLAITYTAFQHYLERFSLKFPCNSKHNMWLIAYILSGHSAPPGRATWMDALLLVPLFFFLHYSDVTHLQLNVWTNKLQGPNRIYRRQYHYRASPRRLEEPNGGRSAASRRERELESNDASAAHHRPVTRTTDDWRREPLPWFADCKIEARRTVGQREHSRETNNCCGYIGLFTLCGSTERIIDLNALTVPYPGLESEREGAAPRATERDRRII